MASGKKAFSIKGPTHLTSVDWNNAHHRRTVAASLVNGVYERESYRQATLRGSRSQSFDPQWWKFFHFELIHLLRDDDDDSIFGAIFKFKPLANAYYHTNDRSPCYVIAFRGTLIRSKSLLGDFKLTIEILRNRLHRKSRFVIAMEAVREKVATVGAPNLWLTGHSLGAAMAMQVGKTMAKEGKFLEALLFNPPYTSLPIELMKDGKVKDLLQITGTVMKAVHACKAAEKGYQDSFAAMSEWIPCLFVNQADLLCCGYRGYFQNRKRLEDNGAGDIARLTCPYSLTNLIMRAIGIKGVETSEPLHRLPSANLTVNTSPSKNCLQAHKLKHWWRPNSELDLKCTVYKYN